MLPWLQKFPVTELEVKVTLVPMQMAKGPGGKIVGVGGVLPKLKMEGKEALHAGATLLISSVTDCVPPGPAQNTLIEFVPCPEIIFPPLVTVQK